jgi:hypothetical protein
VIGPRVRAAHRRLEAFAFREEHPIRRDHLRWGLLVIGALGFMDV